MKALRRGGGPRAGRTHAGLDHSRALGDPAEPHRFAAKQELDGDLLGLRVARQDGLGGFRSGGLGGLELPGDGGDALSNVRHRQRDADPAGRTDEHVGGFEAKRLAGERGHFECVGQALRAGAGVGIAGVDDDGARGAVAQMRDAELHRRGANLVCRKHPGGFRRDVGDDKREVPFLALVAAFAGAECFDIAKPCGRPEAKRRGD